MRISFSLPNKLGIFCLGTIKIYVNEVGFRAGWRAFRNPKYKFSLELSIYVMKFDSSPKNAKSVPPLLCSRSAYLSASSSRKQFIACRPLLARSHLQIISTRRKDGVRKAKNDVQGKKTCSAQKFNCVLNIWRYLWLSLIWLVPKVIFLPRGLWQYFQNYWSTPLVQYIIDWLFLVRFYRFCNNPRFNF